MQPVTSYNAYVPFLVEWAGGKAAFFERDEAVAYASLKRESVQKVTLWDDVADGYLIHPAINPPEASFSQEEARAVIRQAFRGRGAAVRRREDPPIPGEPFISIDKAVEQAADVLVKFAMRSPQPISNAPRDGTRILVSAPGCGWEISCWSAANDTWISQTGTKLGTWPTVWFPLPEAPEQRQ